MAESQYPTLAVLHRFFQIELAGLHSFQRLRLFLSADRFRSIGAAMLPNVSDSSHVPTNMLVLEVQPSDANAQVPAGFYRLPEEFGQRSLKEVADWLVGRTEYSEQRA